MPTIKIQLDSQKLKEKLNLKDGVAGADGKDYILTEKDKKDIAKNIKIPVVTKEIETIVKEQPIITNEIKEVAKYEEPDVIVEKLNTLENVLDYKVLKNIPELEIKPNGGGWRNLWQLHDVSVPTPTNGQSLIYNATNKLWEAGTIITTDEKVKYDAGDPTAGYLGAKIVAGTGITLSEGTGADENKLKITNSLDLSGYLKTDQTTPQTTVGKFTFPNADISGTATAITTPVTPTCTLRYLVDVINAGAPSFTYGGMSGYVATGLTHSYKIYTYLTVNGTKFYNFYETVYTLDNGGAGYADDVSGLNYYIFVGWDAPATAVDGYCILKKESGSGYDYNYYYETGTTSFDDTSPALWTSGDPTATTPRLIASAGYTWQLKTYEIQTINGLKYYSLPATSIVYTDANDGKDYAVQWNVTGVALLKVKCESTYPLNPTHTTNLNFTSTGYEKVSVGLTGIEDDGAFNYGNAPTVTPNGYFSNTMDFNGNLTLDGYLTVPQNITSLSTIEGDYLKPTTNYKAVDGTVAGTASTSGLVFKNGLYISGTNNPLAIGTAAQIPFMSATNTAFSYSSDFKYAAAILYTPNIKISGLTSGRVPYATTAGQLTDSPFRTNGTNIAVGGAVGGYLFDYVMASASAWTADVFAGNRLSYLGNTNNGASIFEFAGQYGDGTYGGVKIGAVISAAYTGDFVVANRNNGNWQENFRIKGNGNIQIPNDNAKLLFGTGQDVGVKYDGTNTIWANDIGTGYMSFGMQILAQDKIMFTQIDGNEYWDSLNDGELDGGATISINGAIGGVEQIQLFDGKLAPTTDSDIDLGDTTHYYKNAYIDYIVTSGKLAMRPAFVSGSIAGVGKPTAVNIGVWSGYSMPISDGTDDEVLHWRILVPGRWDGASNITYTVVVTLANAEDVNDKFRFQLDWNHTDGVTSAIDTTAVQNIVCTEVTIGAGTAAQYSVFELTFTIDWDIDTPDIVAGDILAGKLWRTDSTGTDTGEILVLDHWLDFNVNKVFKTQ